MVDPMDCEVKRYYQNHLAKRDIKIKIKIKIKLIFIINSRIKIL
jgi:hypothetical protein